MYKNEKFCTWTPEQIIPLVPTTFQQNINITQPPQYLNNNQKNVNPGICERLKEYHGLSQIIQSVLEITATIMKVMRVCDIHECKCQQATDIIIYAFLHFDEYSIDGICGRYRRRICKLEFQYELRTKCNFTKDEAKLTYSIIKYAFHAFYFNQPVPRFDELFIDKCAWILAGKRTFTAYKKMINTKKETLPKVKVNINCIYQDYVDKRLRRNRFRNIIERED